MFYSHSQLSEAQLLVNTPPAPAGLRIGIMGGSFNPAHDGHRIVARTALRRLKLDRLWWLVTPGNPLKSHDDLAPLDARMADARVMASDPRMIVTSFEAELSSPYTAATLGFLRDRFPATHFVWVMGADNLATFHRWQNWRNIVATMPIAVVDRPGWHLKALSSPAARAMALSRVHQEDAAMLPEAGKPAWTFLTTRLSPLSSTHLRRAKQQV